MRATLRGHAIGRPGRDTLMMPGMFAIDQRGIIRAAHYARHVGDQADIGALLAALRATG